MTNHLTEQELNDLADGTSSAERERALNLHVAVCAQCRSEVTALRDILAELQALPREIAPERDLLASIHEQLDQESVVPIRQRTLWSLRYGLAAAAIVLIIASSLLTRALLDRSAPAPTQELAGAPATTTLVSDMAGLEADYVRAIDELRRLAIAQRTQLPPETVALLEQNLAVIDRAIRESRDALQQDPRNEMVTQMLRSAYEMKLDLLRRATAAPAT